MKSLFVLLIFCLILTGCGSVKNANSVGGHAHEIKPNLDVKLDISGRQLTVSVATDITVSPEHYGKERKAGEGHLHMYLDNGEKIGVTEAKRVFDDLAPGPHILKVSLHNNDHTPYDVTKTFEFEIK